MRNPLQGKPFTQGVIASAIVQITWSGASAVIGYITGHFALRSLPPWLALLVGAVVFFLLALSYYLFFGRRILGRSNSKSGEIHRPEPKLESNLAFEVAVNDSQVKFVGGGTHVRHIEADIKLRCLKTSDSMIGVRDFRLSLHRGLEGGGEAIVAQDHFKRVLEHPSMANVSIDDGWTIREPISSYRWFMFMLDITPSTQAELSSDFFFRLTMDAVGQQVITQDIRVQSWQDARTSNSSISLRPPPPQLEHDLLESRQKATEWQRKYYDAHNAAIPIQTQNENYETQISELQTKLRSVESNHTQQIDELNAKLDDKIEDLKTAKREAKTANLKADTEAQDKRFIRELKERAENELGELTWLIELAKEQAKDISNHVTVMPHAAWVGEIAVTGTHLSVYVWLRIRNESVFNLSIKPESIAGRLSLHNVRFKEKAGQLVDDFRPPIHNLKPGEYDTVILEQPLLEFEAEIIKRSAETDEFWIGNMNIPISINNDGFQNSDVRPLRLTTDRLAISLFKRNTNTA